jgi:hypothetical protein
MADRVTTTPKPSRQRVSGKVMAAIEAIVFEALPVNAASEKAGLSRHGLYKAMRKPPVMAYYRGQLEVLRESAGPAGVAKVVSLMHAAGSEHVQLAAAQWAAGIQGIAPVQRSEIQHDHRGMAPGMVLNLIQAPPQPAIIDQPAPARIADLNTMPRRVPHPSERKS